MLTFSSYISVVCPPCACSGGATVQVSETWDEGPRRVDVHSVEEVPGKGGVQHEVRLSKSLCLCICFKSIKNNSSLITATFCCQLPTNVAFEWGQGPQNLQLPQHQRP